MFEILFSAVIVSGAVKRYHWMVAEIAYRAEIAETERRRK